MAALDTSTIDHLAKLCRLACTEEEKRSLLQDLNNILQYVETLQECDTADTEPLACVIQGQNSLLLREDEEEMSLTQAEFLSLSPARVAGLVKVPNILE